MKKSNRRVAYFCMEYGLESDFKIYAGGLGILAGDIIKGARDQEMPMVAIGLLWKQGYGDQAIDAAGNPYDAYPIQRYDFLEDTGVTVSVAIRQRRVLCKVWKYEQNCVPLYLLDTDHPENDGADRWICGQLYGWFGEERIAQEMVLGVGGVLLLRKLGLEVDVHHFNEGHAVFAGLALIREKMDTGLSFEEAVAQTRREVVFTTHTPIVQGNESHSLDRLLYMGANLGLSIEQLATVGGAPFNMTVAGLRLARLSNAVSQCHADTAAKMWSDVETRSEIISVTNGIHRPTWVDASILELMEDGPALWQAHQINKHKLIEAVSRRTGIDLDAERLLIGFARRAAPYKRSDLFFSDMTKTGAWLESREVQIVFSGKAHPLDDTGKRIVSQLVKMMRRFPRSVVFLENYDMALGRALTRGCDVWLNTPRCPMEACGTSGMKAAMNGVLNCSVLDGWWPEVCRHGENGWQFGDGHKASDFRKQEVKTTQDGFQALDAHDAKAMYAVLENEVIPTYYEDRTRWVRMMQASILSTKDAFSTKRMLKEYDHMYQAQDLAD